MRLSDAIESYIEHKRALGMKFYVQAIQLRAFVKSVGNNDITVESSAILNFLNGSGPITSNWFSKYYALNTFYRYAVARGYSERSPLPLTLPRKADKFDPYIFTRNDIKRLLAAASSRHRRIWLLEPHTIRTLLILLYASGLRISEALRLDLGDFDSENSILTIRESKFHKLRLVPVGPDLRFLLCNYIDQQWPSQYRIDANPLLATKRLERIPRDTAESVFRRVREEAGVSRRDNARYQPRLHDLRHTFAVVRLITWYRDQKTDVQKFLPHLSTYLGHSSIVDTQRYLTITPELLEQASVRFERFVRSGERDG